MEAVEPLVAPPRWVAHERGVNRDLVLLQVVHALFPGGFAAVLLAVGDDIDHAKAFLGARGKLLGCLKDGIVQSVNLLGNADKGVVACVTAGLKNRRDAASVLAAVAGGHRAA